MTMTTLAVIDIVGKDNYWTIAITDRFLVSQANLALNSDIELSRNLALALLFSVSIVETICSTVPWNSGPIRYSKKLIIILAVPYGANYWLYKKLYHNNYFLTEQRYEQVSMHFSLPIKQSICKFQVRYICQGTIVQIRFRPLHGVLTSEVH